MILDSQELFSSSQDLTGAAVGDTASTNVLDTQAAHDEGIGEPMHLFASVNNAITSGGAATVQIVIQTSADNVTFKDVVMTDAIPVANLVAGYQRTLKLPSGLLRYNRLAYRVGTAALTAGKITAGLVKDVQNNKAYNSGFTVA